MILPYPPIINGANPQVAWRILVTRALGLPRNLALEHLKCAHPFEKTPPQVMCIKKV